MAWNLEEVIEYYRNQGAPRDQNALVNLLKEIQQESGGALSAGDVARVAQEFQIKESFLLAIIKRFPGLRLNNRHCLEICCGGVCGKKQNFSAFLSKTYGKNPEKFEIKYTSCMRMCGKGPNIKWDGKIYHGADEALLRQLIEKK